MALTKQLLYRSGNGDCWSLMTDAASGRRFVRHEANPSSGGHVTDTDVEAFLAIRGSGPEFVALREMSGPPPGVGVSALDAGREIAPTRRKPRMVRKRLPRGRWRRKTRSWLAAPMRTCRPC
jgi:hypothetical protein